jgi:hypothetical protein
MAEITRTIRSGIRGTITWTSQPGYLKAINRRPMHTDENITPQPTAPIIRAVEIFTYGSFVKIRLKEILFSKKKVKIK